jgi:hypothetical protein
MKNERQALSLASATILLETALAIALIVGGHAPLGVAVLGVGVAFGAVLLTMGRRMSDIDSEEHRARAELGRAKYEVEVLHLLESIDRRLAALTATSGASKDRERRGS